MDRHVVRHFVKSPVIWAMAALMCVLGLSLWHLWPELSPFPWKRRRQSHSPVREHLIEPAPRHALDRG